MRPDDRSSSSVRCGARETGRSGRPRPGRSRRWHSHVVCKEGAKARPEASGEGGVCPPGIAAHPGRERDAPRVVHERSSQRLRRQRAAARARRGRPPRRRSCSSRYQEVAGSGTISPLSSECLPPTRRTRARRRSRRSRRRRAAPRPSARAILAGDEEAERRRNVFTEITAVITFARSASGVRAVNTPNRAVDRAA